VRRFWSTLKWLVDLCRAEEFEFQGSTTPAHAADCAISEASARHGCTCGAEHPAASPSDPDNEMKARYDA
jgi:hypothetical protein